MIIICQLPIAYCLLAIGYCPLPFAVSRLTTHDIEILNFLNIEILKF